MGCVHACCKQLPNDGLDVNTYHEIIKQQEREKITPGEEQWSELIANDEQRFSNNQKDWAHYWPQDQEFDNGTMSFRRDLMNHKPVWVNHWKKDWWNFMQTNHAFIGIFAAPKEDEYSHRERAMVLLCCSSLFSIVALIAVTVEWHQIERGFPSLGILAWNNLITITGAITVSIIQLYLQCMATCSCYQKDEEVRERMETWGHVTMAVWALGGAFLFVYGIIQSISLALLDKFFISLCTQVFMNILVPTLILTGQFHLMWKGEHTNGEECQCGDKWEVCYHDYMDYKAGDKLRREWKPREKKQNLVGKMGKGMKKVAKKVVLAEKKGTAKVVGIAKKSAAAVKSVTGDNKTGKDNTEVESGGNEDKQQLEEHMELTVKEE